MSDGSATFRLENASWELVFGSAALDTFRAHAQVRTGSVESVGQLYSRDLTSSQIVVDLATVLKPRWARWAKVQLDMKKAIAEREAQFKQGMHCIGFWHTHPEPDPTPSPDDRAMAIDHASAATPQLAGLVFVIVGTITLPGGLRVWVHDGRELLACSPTD